MIITSAPAKIILCGEHAVVYGIPAIAIPVFSLQATARLELTESRFQIDAVDVGEVLTIDDVHHPLINAVIGFLVYSGESVPPVRLTVSSTVPIASGLGSGASVTTAVIKAVAKYFNLDIDYANLNKLVYEVEKLHHGTPSGIDNTVIVYEKPVYFIKNRSPQPITVNGKYRFVIANTGIPASTKTTVASVKSLYEASPEYTESILDGIQMLVDQMRHALANNEPEILGKLMTKNHNLLQQLHVSIPALDKLVNAAADAGALGAKLSGGGGGGNMIALVTHSAQETVKQALLDAGAKQVFTTELGE